jgi:uncharacterized repeat protein (TIGR01451 family)
MPATAQTRESARRTERFYPTGERATSIIALEREVPEQVRRGDTFNYKIRIKNLTKSPIFGVALTERIAPGIKVEAIDPAPASRSGNSATWRWEKLGPQQAVTLGVRGASDGPDALSCCATVTLSTMVCSETRLVQPELALVKQLPQEVVLCEPIPMRLVVRNTGSGVARNVQIVDDLPEGWKTEEGRTQVSIAAGDLKAGEDQEFRVNLRSERTGTFTNTARATEDGGLSAEATASTAVRKPVLRVSKSCPNFRYVGRPAKIEITVTNDGDVPARDTVLTDTLPAGVELVSTTRSGRTGPANVVTWRLGTLAPGASETVSLTLKPLRIGSLRNTAVAKAYCAEASDECSMVVKGIPAILLEMIDVEDPDEVGTTDTYVITVTNQGSADGTNIRIVCEVQPEAEFVSANAPVGHKVDGRTVTFDPLPSLSPKAKAVYQVTVKGIKAGDTRFRIQLTSDQTTSPVEETESTRFY